MGPQVVPGGLVCVSLQVASPRPQQCDRMWKSDLNKGLVCPSINLESGLGCDGGGWGRGGWAPAGCVERNGSGESLEKASYGLGSG